MSQRAVLLTKPGEKEIKVSFGEEGREEEILGLILGEEAGKYDLRVLVDHEKGESRGRVMIKGVVLGGGDLKMEGIIKIREEAQGVDEFLEMRVLLVGEEARARVEPKLEIEANEVKASHAATVGRIDKEEIFYLQSRGIGKKEAEKMLVEGFLREVVERVKDREKRRKIREKIQDIILA